MSEQEPEHEQHKPKAAESVSKWLVGIAGAVFVIVAATAVIGVAAGYMRIASMATEITTLNTTVTEMRAELTVYTKTSITKEEFEDLRKRVRENERELDRREAREKIFEDKITALEGKK